MSDGMETRVRDLEIEQAKQQVVVANLTVVVQENTTAIRELTAVLNKSKGAWWAVAGVSSVFGGAIATAFAWFRG